MTKAMACVGVPMVGALSAAPVAASRWRSLEKSAGVRRSCRDRRWKNLSEFLQEMLLAKTQVEALGLR
jgi:hypothetical protein